MDQHTAEAADQLLGEGDIPPVHEVNAEGQSLVLLTADHYGRVLPRALGDLGVAASEMTRHTPGTSASPASPSGSPSCWMHI